MIVLPEYAMQIPCIVCKNIYRSEETESATEELPFCSKCHDEYAEVLQYAYEQAIYEYFKYQARQASKISLESLPVITKLAAKYAASVIAHDDLYLTGMYLRYIYDDDFVAYSHKELLYNLSAVAPKKHQRD